MSISSIGVSNSDTTKLEKLENSISNVGFISLSTSVAIVLAWIGAMKFTAYEAGAIEGLVASSPLTSWLYKVASLQGASNLIGSIEILTALLILVGMKFEKVALVGAISAFITFFITSTFLFSAPGWEASLGGFPALSVVPGQFLLKDIVLLAVATVLIGDALKRIVKNA